MTIDDLKKKTVTELKAMAYDQVAQLEMTQKNLSVLNQLITEKANEKPVDPDAPAA